jgi:hypothetical protein
LLFGSGKSALFGKFTMIKPHSAVKVWMDCSETNAQGFVDDGQLKKL